MPENATQSLSDARKPYEMTQDATRDSVRGSKARKSKTCKVCRIRFVPTKPMQVVCGPQCATQYAWRIKAKEEVKQAREERLKDRANREKLKTRSDYIKEAQIAFNAYIRERDKGIPCICCGLPLGDNEVGGNFDCGHYRSVGSAPHLRFDERNAHGQRKRCNRYGAGRAVDYRRGLIDRIGIQETEVLESDNTPRKWTIDELKEIKETYKRKLKELRNGN